MICCLGLSYSWAQNSANYATSPTYIGGYHIKCHGQSTGTIKASPTFGTAPYTFLWNTGETTAQINNKPAGIYIVTITDSLNVAHTDTFELRQPNALNYQSTLSNFYGYNIHTNNGSSGSIQLSGNGGTPPYTYLWSNGDSSATRNGLTAGNYSFTIADANQCSVNSNITLTQPNPIQLSFTNVQNAQCFKGRDGAATLSINGGLGNFSVVWSNGSFSFSPNDLPTGYNEVRIYEQGKAIIDTGISITSPAPLEVAFSLSQYNNGYNVSCVDCYNGSISTTVSGGTAPYTYLWNDENNSTTANLNNLNGGEYKLILTDAHACEIKESINLRMPTPKDWSRFGNANIDTAEFIGSTDTSAVVFKTNSQEALRLAGNGNVGLGTVAPTEKLEVNGIIKANGLKINNFEFKLTPATSQLPEILSIGKKDIIPIGNIMPRTCLDPLNADRINLFDGAAVFKLQTITPGGSDCKNYDPSFYVGLNGCDGVLEVDESNGNSQLPNKLLLNTFCGKDVIVGKSSSGNLIANYRLGVGVAAPIEKFEVDGNGIIFGKVGIGSAAPEADLHIKNGISNSFIIENTQSPNKFKIEAANGVGRLISDGSVAIFFNSEQLNSGSYFTIQKNAGSFSGSNVELFKINNNGNSFFKESLSIGTISFHPDFKLQVCGGIKAKRVRVEESWCDYVFDDDYELLPLNEVEKYYKTYKHLPDIPPSSEIEINGLDLGKLVSLQMKKIEELTIHLVEMQKEINELKNELAK